jgi:hypothetical protein
MQLSNGTSTLQVCMFQSDTTRECSCQMALLLHKSVCFKQTSRVSATLRWNFYFTSAYVTHRHHAWVQLSDGTSTSKVFVFQTDITRDCSFQMALILHKCVWFKQTSRVSPTVRWLFACTSVYISNRHEAVRNFQMALLLHKDVCFKQKLRVSLAVRWEFYFTSVYVWNRRYAWEQMSNGTSTAQGCILQTDIMRERSSHMELILHKCVCYKHTSRVSAAVRWHFSTSQVCMFTTYMRHECNSQMALRLHKLVYISKWHDAWVQLSDGTSTSLVCMVQSDTTRECNCQMGLLLKADDRLWKHCIVFFDSFRFANDSLRYYEIR